mmetsp:Transcript_1510/g.2424  ORF Transcript_1510/g.2424 Transcript_1510/m.2424 type:complete len:405 (+) Transcript_1510:197-1411(+)
MKYTLDDLNGHFNRQNVAGIDSHPTFNKLILRESIVELANRLATQRNALEDVMSRLTAMEFNSQQAAYATQGTPPQNWNHHQMQGGHGTPAFGNTTKHFDNNLYCYSHGFDVNHSGTTCPNPKQGHVPHAHRYNAHQFHGAYMKGAHILWQGQPSIAANLGLNVSRASYATQQQPPQQQEYYQHGFNHYTPQYQGWGRHGRSGSRDGGRGGGRGLGYSQGYENRYEQGHYRSQGGDYGYNENYNGDRGGGHGYGYQHRLLGTEPTAVTKDNTGITDSVSTYTPSYTNNQFAALMSEVDYNEEDEYAQYDEDDDDVTVKISNVSSRYEEDDDDGTGQISNVSSRTEPTSNIQPTREALPTRNKAWKALIGRHKLRASTDAMFNTAKIKIAVDQAIADAGATVTSK